MRIPELDKLNSQEENAIKLEPYRYGLTIDEISEMRGDFTRERIFYLLRLP